MNPKLTAEEFLELQATQIQTKPDFKKKEPLVKRRVSHFDSADYEKARYIKALIEPLGNK